MFSNEADQYLSSLINHEYHLSTTTPNDFKLTRTRSLLELAGNPQDSLTIIHIAGSKGKGSTAALTANILKCAGYRAGLYTSPHMINYRERIRVLDQTSENSSQALFDDMISEEKLSFLVTHLKPLADDLDQAQLGNITFYEFLTVLAFCYFKDQNVDLVVLETGLGGRLDATNCCSSLVAAITPISMEHTNLLGDTLSKIASEKGGIIKEGTRCAVLANQEQEALDILTERCADQKVNVYRAAERIESEIISQDKDGQQFNLRSTQYELMNARSPLLGKHQLDNIVTASSIMEALLELKYDIPQNAVREGIKTVFWPCRFEIISDEPAVIVDGAHNVSSAKYLLETYTQVFGQKDFSVIIGVSDDKDIRGMLDELKNAKRIIATRADHPRAYTFNEDELKDIFRNKEIHLTDTVQEALDLVCDINPAKETVLVTGSLFVASEARRLWPN